MAEAFDGTEAERRVERWHQGEPARLHCRRCRTWITGTEHIVRLEPESGLVRTFANPDGHLFEVVAFSWARALGLHPDVTDAFTWFPGYAWRIAVCSGCANHLGWQYEAIGRSRPDLFFGLLIRELVAAGEGT